MGGKAGEGMGFDEGAYVKGHKVISTDAMLDRIGFE